MDENSKPVAALSPAAIPIHWEEQVKQGLEGDVRLGVLERVSVNDPVKWCSHMLVQQKHDGAPRGVVDFQPVHAHAHFP